MLKIVTAPDPILNTVCDPCVPGDKSLKKLARQMEKAMYKNSGVGLAAPQVGVLQRLIVIDCTDQDPKDPTTLVNPEIVETRGEMVRDAEGCLSVPGINVEIERHEWVRVRYFDLDGNECEISGDGLLGRCLQHEIDHLDGKTMLESCGPLERLKALQDYEEAKARGAMPGDVGE